ncbi:hypothetical protein K0B96_12875 [Horticoccus luteus]|uniref:PBP domain-containing protein n=1 Tax=Horticoccus luteus TaxID=2862869 RepID=A0A8F9XGG2_9BACT|nr:substrate-binding domain-containing protein [Horticoccus luteus]QYM78190.1 hypothetical protein K0B96_12875 [Horticoccus luteus]
MAATSLAIAAPVVRIVASDLLGEKWATAMQRELAGTGQAVSVELTGSYRGGQELQDGKAQIGLLMFSPTEKLPEAPFFATPIAFEVVVVEVPRDLPLAELTLEQLAGIFGADRQKNMQRWGDLGVVGPWQTRPIAPHVLAPEGALTGPIFRQQVLGRRAMAATVGVQEDWAALRARVPADAGIVVLTAAPVEAAAGLKALSIARDPAAGAFALTAENVYRGDYPLRWPVYLVLRRDAARPLLPVVRELLSADAAERWREAGRVPLPESVRAGVAYQLEVLEK